MRIFKYFFLLMLLSVSFFPLGCGKNKTVEPNSTSAIYVLVTNELNEPIPGAVVTTSPQTQAVTTDENGNAVIKDVAPRTYNVIINKTGSPECNQYVKIVNNDNADVHFIIFTRLTINVRDEFDRPVKDTLIKTKPETQNVITDEHGVAVLVNVPLQTYQFVIERPELPPINRNVVLEENSYEGVDFILTSESPVVHIIEPENNMVFSAYNIVFKGTGTDYEDGELPDSQLVWSSNLDGQLGTGKVITVDELSVGNHIITLECTDSDNKKGRAKITVIIADYNPDSYFPLLDGATWDYRHLESSFYIVNSSNVNELWEIKNLSISIDKEKKRKSVIEYDITIGLIVKHFRYTLIDNLEEDNNNLYVTATTEEMREWKEDDGTPYLTMNINTSYTPRYMILKNITNPSADSLYSTTTRAETEWSYVYFNSPSATFRESFILDTAIQIGQTKYVQTDKGLFSAIMITISSTDSVKNWWLTKGLGLVRLDYTLANLEHSAVLADSYMLRFYRQYKPAEAAGKASSTLFTTPVRNFHINRNTGEGLMELRHLLKSMNPEL